MFSTQPSPHTLFAKELNRRDQLRDVWKEMLAIVKLKRELQSDGFLTADTDDPRLQRWERLLKHIERVEKD